MGRTDRTVSASRQERRRLLAILALVTTLTGVAWYLPDLWAVLYAVVSFTATLVGLLRLARADDSAPRQWQSPSEQADRD